ncbi:unnamed protein product [Rhizophagus irregularis]|nr:unnamed protein product [Rhizophagus irregularis]
MELVKLNDENSFDPTPKLKSSPVPIFFVSFNSGDYNCIHCGEEYIYTPIYCQKYCKTCLSSYLTNITDNNIYLDCLFTKDLECNEHEISRTKVPQNIQECCRNCLTILYFKQMPESTLTKKLISIIYLPWWENRYNCFCDNIENRLIFTSNCQKYCGYCFVFFIGCRYCLTTNIIFGYTNQSQCKKCKRVSTIIFDITKLNDIVNDGNSDLGAFLASVRPDYEIVKFTNYVKNIDKCFFPSKICANLSNKSNSLREPQNMKYITYSQFTNVKKIAEGGYGIVYQAIFKKY